MSSPNSFIRTGFRADLLRVALFSFLCLALVSAQEAADGPQPLPGESRCGFCKTTGRLEFEVDNKFEVERDHGETWEVLHCSEAYEADNMALPWMPCSRCKTPSLKEAAESEWNAVKARGDSWLPVRRRVDTVAKLKKPMVHLETTHFVIAWDIPKIKTNKKKTLKAHHAAHLYGARLEDLYADFQKRFGISDKENMKNKHYIYVFERQLNFQLAAPVYTGLLGTSTVKRAGGANHESAVVTWLDRGEFPTDDDFFRHLTHSMVHQISAVYYDVHWFEPGEIGLTPPWLADKYGWLDAGLAHWFERRLEGRTDTYCIREQNTTDRWKGADWHNNIYKSVVAEESPLFADTIYKPTQALTAREHQFVWSWVDYLMRPKDDQSEVDDEQGQTEDEQGQIEDDKGLNLDVGLAMRLCKEEVATRNILSQALDENMLTFDTHWAEWVKEEYAPSKRKKKNDEVYRPLLPLR